MHARARRVTMVGWGLAGLAALMLPWTAYLFIALPGTAPAAHFDLAWGGFDVALLFLLALTGWAALRHARWLGAAAGATAALLATDAWFDVVTSPSTKERWVAVAMAVVVELPLAVVCAWLALKGQELVEQRLALALRRRHRVAGHNAAPVRRTTR